MPHVRVIIIVRRYRPFSFNFNFNDIPFLGLCVSETTNVIPWGCSTLSEIVMRAKQSLVRMSKMSSVCVGASNGKTHTIIELSSFGCCLAISRYLHRVWPMTVDDQGWATIYFIAQRKCSSTIILINRQISASSCKLTHFFLINGLRSVRTELPHCDGIALSPIKLNNQKEQSKALFSFPYKRIKFSH